MLDIAEGPPHASLVNLVISVVPLQLESTQS